MKAALLYGIEDVRIIDVPKPVPGPGEVVAKVELCLTSGTVIKQYKRGYPGWGYPHGFGYEWAGRIVEVGEGVDESLVGMKCTSKVAVPDDCDCFFCIRNYKNLCARRGHALDKVRREVDKPEEGIIRGFFAEYVRLPIRWIDLIPEDVPFEDACQIPYLAYAVHGTKRVSINPGDYVAVIGSGAAGILHMMLAHLRGGRTIAIDVNPERLEFARKVGAADYTIQASTAEEVWRAFKDLNINNGYGPDVVIEAVGLPSTYEEAIQIVRRGGQVLLYAGAPEDTSITVDTYRLHYDEITVTGSVGVTPHDYVQAHDLIVNRMIKPGIFISGRFPLSKIKEALELHSSGKGVKFAIIP